MAIKIIVAVTRDNAIGRGGDMLYHLSDDLKRFKRLTMGHPLVMGRKTFESLPGGALPGRRNLVVTRNSEYSAPGAETFGTLQAALEAAAKDGDVFVIGGGEIYRQAMPLAQTLLLTVIDTDGADSADTFFPAHDTSEWVLTEAGEPLTDARSGVRYRFETWQRRE